MPAHRLQHLIVPCGACGSPVRPKPSRLARNAVHYCGQQCATIGRMRPRPHRRTRVDVPCDYCGNPLSVARYRRARYARTFCSLTCRSQWRSRYESGASSPQWRGGHPAYYGPNWKRQKAAARQRDGYRCTKCGVAEAELGRLLDVHHIIPFRFFGYEPGINLAFVEANALPNLRSLCAPCHGAEELRGAVAPKVLALPLSAVTHKYCPRCQQPRLVDQFTHNRRRGDGLCAYCKDCIREYNRELADRRNAS